MAPLFCSSRQVISDLKYSIIARLEMSSPGAPSKLGPIFSAAFFKILFSVLLDGGFVSAEADKTDATKSKRMDEVERCVMGVTCNACFRANHILEFATFPGQR